MSDPSAPVGGCDKSPGVGRAMSSPSSEKCVSVPWYRLPSQYHETRTETELRSATTRGYVSLDGGKCPRGDSNTRHAVENPPGASQLHVFAIISFANRGSSVHAAHNPGAASPAPHGQPPDPVGMGTGSRFACRGNKRSHNGTARLEGICEFGRGSPAHSRRSSYRSVNLPSTVAEARSPRSRVQGAA